LKDIHHITKVVMEECKGFPLAINVIASTMIGNWDLNLWNLALRKIRIMDSNFTITHPRIHWDLYQWLRWSYDSLPHEKEIEIVDIVVINTQNNILYCTPLHSITTYLHSWSHIQLILTLEIGVEIISQQPPTNLKPTLNSTWKHYLQVPPLTLTCQILKTQTTIIILIFVWIVFISTYTNSSLIS